MKKSKPKAVLISDVHYNLSTLPLADSAMRSALHLAETLEVPCIVAGDLHDTKALLRGECVSAMIETFRGAKCRTLVMAGNHDRINEKDKAHSLEFLKGFVEFIEEPTQVPGLGVWMIPYESNPEVLLGVLSTIPKGSTLVMHQGLKTAKMGHYIQDKTSLPPEAFDGFRVISGHYHLAQTIQCGKTGVFDYIGNPYTLTFGEANDGPKGIQVLYDDGTLRKVPLNLRRHIVLEYTIDSLPSSLPETKPGDLIWMKLSGPKSKLARVDKRALGMKLFGHCHYKLDLIPDGAEEVESPKENQTEAEILDGLIDGLGDSAEHRGHLKGLWRELVK